MNLRAAIVVSCLIASRVDANSSTHAAACPPARTGVVILAKSHELLLCENGDVTATFSVSLGHGGLDKRREGDEKTPLGSYKLGTPRPSDKFHVFIPVAYPTPEQRRNGMNGGDVGIHGPKRKLKWLGRLVNVVDWTRGCIAVNRDEDIEVIAAWLRKRPDSGVEIRRE